MSDSSRRLLKFGTPRFTSPLDSETTEFDVTCIGEGLGVFARGAPCKDASPDLFTLSAGGSEVNTALGLASMGRSVALVSCLGADLFGEVILERLRSRNVDVSHVAISSDALTGIYFKLGDPSVGLSAATTGRRQVMYFRNQSAARADLHKHLAEPRILRLLEKSRVVHTTGITLAVLRTARPMWHAMRRRRPSQILSIDVNWRESLWQGRTAYGRSLLRKACSMADAVFLGRDEAIRVYATDNPERLRRLIHGPRYLVVKDEANEVVAFDRSKLIRSKPQTVKVVDVVGAGDAFSAGFLGALAVSEPIESCVHLGQEAAASVLQLRRDHL